MQREKRQIDSSIFNNSGIDQLSDQVLDIPIKKSKQIKQILKLRATQQKILQQANLKPSQRNSLTNRSRSISSFQKHPNPTQSNTSYVMGCIIRSLTFRKLAIDDIAHIFEIEGEIVEEIDKYRRLKQFQGGNNIGGNPKLEMMRNKLMRTVEKSVRMAILSLGEVNSFNDSDSSLQQRKSSFTGYNRYSSTRSRYQAPAQNQFSLPQPQHFPPNHNSSFNAISNNLLSPSQSPNSLSKLPQYQRLLRYKPPHRIDNKTVAIVEILKKRPNISQKDIMKVLTEEYGITKVTQTAVSRYVRRIYDMKKHVDVILQAQKDGLVLL